MIRLISSASVVVEFLQLVVSVLVAVVLLHRVGVDVIGRTRRFLDLDAGDAGGAA